MFDALNHPIAVLAAAAEPLADQVSINHFLVVSAILFSIGIATIVVKRNLVWLLIGVELLLNAAGLNFVAFTRYGMLDRINLDGQIVTVFVVMLAAAEAAVALAIILNIHTLFSTIDADKTSTLKH